MGTSWNLRDIVILNDLRANALCEIADLYALFKKIFKNVYIFLYAKSIDVIVSCGNP